MSLASPKTVLVAGSAAVVAYLIWARCAPGDAEVAREPGSLRPRAAQDQEPQPDRHDLVTARDRSTASETTRPLPDARPSRNAEQAPPPSELETARARLDRVTTKMREAREDLAALTDAERQALFAEGMAAYDSMLAQANREGPEAKAELEALYPEFRELMLAVKPPFPGGNEPADDG